MKVFCLFWRLRLISISLSGLFLFGVRWFLLVIHDRCDSGWLSRLQGPVWVSHSWISNERTAQVRVTAFDWSRTLNRIMCWNEAMILYTVWFFCFVLFFSNPDSINQPPRFLSSKSQGWNFILDDTTLDIHPAFLDTLGRNVVDDHDIYMRKKTQMRNDATKTTSKE